MSHPPTPATTANSAPGKPRFALAIATAFGLGYLPLAPGTFGSVGGVLLVILTQYGVRFVQNLVDFPHGRLAARTWLVLYFLFHSDEPSDGAIRFQIWLLIVIALSGVVAATRVAAYLRLKDPQNIVIDEVSGQQLTYLLASLLPVHATTIADVWRADPLGLTSPHSVLNWKFLLAGFILFRVFDIWKPFPARQAESLPGGWGIMADDWIAAIYAALGLWALRAVGL